MAWPGTAGVVVALVFATRGTWKGGFILNDQTVASINSQLSQGEEEAQPYKLLQNKASFFGTKGTCLYGKGFIISNEDRSAFLTQNAGYEQFIKPYLIAKDFTTDPQQQPSRFVIDFGDMNETEARQYIDLFTYVVAHVKPDRDALRGQIHEKCFWKFWDKRDELYEKLPDLQGVIVCPEVSKYSLFAVLPQQAIFGHVVNVIASDSFGLFGVLQSSFHTAWAWRHGSTMKTDLRYSTSDCLDTFPFPERLIARCATELEMIGKSYHENRRDTMKECEVGLTKTYNRLHDPDQSYLFSAPGAAWAVGVAGCPHAAASG